MVALAYISASAIPGRAANAMQTMKMAQALMAVAPEILTIVAAGQGARDEASLRKLYGVRRIPKMIRLPAGGRLGAHHFAVRAAIAARRYGANLVLSRSIGAAAIAARIGIPTIFECHAPPSGGEKRYWSWLITSLNFRRLVVISDSLRLIMLEQFPELWNKEVVVAHDGVDLEQFAVLPDVNVAKRAVGRDIKRPVAGYAGHLYAGRGVGLILDCATDLPEWDFVIAGGTEADVAALRVDILKRRLANVELMGFVANAELAERLAVADVLLMPYQKSVMVSGGNLDTARWMSPLKMFEYMAMGRAIIASDLPVLREILNENLAQLVPPEDKQAWVAALRALQSDCARNSLAKSAREAVCHHSWTARNNLILGDLLVAG